MPIEKLFTPHAAQNHAIAYRFTGPLTVAYLKSSLLASMQMHPEFRLKILRHDSLHTEANIDFTIAPLEEAVLQFGSRDGWLEYILTRPFDCVDAPLARAGLLIGDDNHILVFVSRQTVDDLCLLTQAVLSHAALTYNCLAQGKPPPPVAMNRAEGTSISMPIKDSIAPNILGEVLAAAQYKHNLPTDNQRTVASSIIAEKVDIIFSDKVISGLIAICKHVGVDLHTMLLTAFQLLVGKWSVQSDFVICARRRGSTEALSDMSSLSGSYIIPIPVKLTEHVTFLDLLESTKKEVYEIDRRTYDSFEHITSTIEPSKEGATWPLLPCFFELNQSGPLPNFGEAAVEHYTLKTELSNFQLGVKLSYDTIKLCGCIEYSNIFERDSIIRLGDYFNHILDQIVSNPHTDLNLFTLLSEEKVKQILIEWGTNPHSGIRHNKAAHELFDEVASRVPSNVAIIFGGDELSYGRVSDMSNQLANYLLHKGVRPGHVVGLLVNRSPSLVIGMLAILKCGAMYMPMDSDLPRDRLDYMIQNSQAKAVVTDVPGHVELTLDNVAVLRLDMISNLLLMQSIASPSVQISPNQGAYVIYTSGSTGRPKGVIGSHRSVTNRLLSQDWIHKTSPHDVWCQKGNIGFVDSVFETLQPLVMGHPLVLMDERTARDPELLVSNILAKGVTRLVTVPSLARAMIGSNDLIRKLQGVSNWILSGEVLNASLARDLLTALPNCNFVNLYGSTEVAADATAYTLYHASHTIPIGRPLPNVKVYILDESLRPVHAGVTGELYIGGAGVALGYINSPLLTKERFIESPFDNGEPLFKTGDLARYLYNGEIEYIGRKDNQIKIRGQRIELEEIETTLFSADGIEECAAVGLNSVDDTRIVCFIVISNDARVEIEELREHLKICLPHYMLPSTYLFMKALPRSPNGKVDRQALTELAARMEPVSTGDYIPPETSTETTLAAIWEEILSVSKIGKNDDFFELGGHSLLGIKVVARVRLQFGADISLQTLYENSSIAKLAAHIDRSIPS